MREIKFRAWDISQKQIVKNPSLGFLKGWLGDDIVCCVDCVFKNTKDRLTWMQYTGLKDKNGKEIYEGDIVDVYPVNPFRHSVKKRNVITWINSGLFLKSVDQNVLGHGELPGSHRIEVIGNIYENPELLK